MVVFDGRFNGYRDILLPLACEHDLVKTAIMVASMYHLGTNQPALRKQADASYNAVVQRLRLDAQHSPDQSTALSTSAWTVVLILLTAETVSGGTNLPYLFKMLRFLASANETTNQGSVLHSFLVEQTNM
jgi:Fungal specific transcription factor domain